MRTFLADKLYKILDCRNHKLILHVSQINGVYQMHI